MDYTDIVAVLAVLQFVFFSALVARARGAYGVKAPAMTGHELFERALRVQMNTLEQLVVFLPGLLLAGQYWPQTAVSAVGLIYLLGRFIYWQGYTRAPEQRTIGFVLSIFPSLCLLAAALVGAIRA